MYNFCTKNDLKRTFTYEKDLLVFNLRFYFIFTFEGSHLFYDCLQGMIPAAYVAKKNDILLAGAGAGTGKGEGVVAREDGGGTKKARFQGFPQSVAPLAQQ